MLRARPPVVLLLIAVVVPSCVRAATAGGPAGPSLTPVPSAPSATTAVCPTPVVDDPGAVVDTLRTGAGGCVPASSAVVFRCDATFDPVAILDAGGKDTRRFLGGSFAVPVPAVPDSAHPVGVTAWGRIYEDASDPRALYVESGGTVSRWLALPHRHDVGAPPTVQLIGDSILDGASTLITEDLGGWSVAIDAVVGRSSSGGVPVAESLATVPDVVVVELGVNDHHTAVFTANAERILSAVAGADLIVWVTPHAPSTVTDEIDQAIPGLLATRQNAAIADWNAAVPLDQLTSDGVHLADATGAPFADFLTPILTTWHLAATGRGPDRCGAAVARAIVGQDG